MLPLLNYDGITLVIAIFIILITWYLYKWHKFKQNLPRFPGRIWPLLGNNFMNIYEKAGGEMKMLEDQRRLNSDAFCLYSIGFTITVITDYKLLYEVFVTNQQKSSHRAKVPKIAEKIAVTNGITGASGRLWQLHRKECLIALRKLGLGVTTLENKTMLEADALSKHLSTLESKTSIDSMKNIFATATTNIVFQLCFGKRFVYGDENYLKLLEAIEAILAFTKIDLRILLPKCIRNLPIIYDRKGDKAVTGVNFLKEFLYREIEVQGNDVDEETVLGILRNKQKILPDEFSEKDIMAICLDFLIAGTDTTSVSLTWMIHFLNNHPDVQEKAKREVKEVLNGRKPEYADINQMPIMHALILESLRFGSPVATTLFHRIVDDIVTSREYILPKDTLVVGSLFAVMRDRNVFKYPDSFDLRNFLMDDNQILKPDNFIAFSMGPRICPGEKLAKLQLFLFATTFIQNFTVSAIEGKCHGVNAADVGITRNPLNYEFNIIKDS